MGAPNGGYIQPMGARGPHDDFESAATLLRRGYVEYAEHRDIDRICDDYMSDDLEYVTRNGTFKGPDQWKSELSVQTGRWQINNELKDVIDAGDGALILLTEFRRIDRESGEVVWKTWPALVVRVLDGKLVFLEGYIDSRRALEEFGVEQG
jgi:ketosteroid isomerase-like protein